MNDPEQAELMAEAERASEDKTEWSPRLRDYTLQVLLLKDIREALVGKRFPAPTTAVDRARRELQKKYALDLIQVYTPHALERS